MFGISLLNNAWLFWGGSALIAAPIIIHLLSKRKFRIVDWAAMEFLLEADRRNRRRIRMENLLLLLLRCLAVILIALLVARPQINAAGFMASAIKSGGIDRIVVLDDSLSMAATENNRVSFTSAVEGLNAFADGLGAGHGSDSLTVIRTSHPHGPHPLDRKKISDPGGVKQIKDALDALRPSDLSARLSEALDEARGRLSNKDAGNRKVLYIISDMRRRDWQASSDLPEDQTLPGKIKQLAGKADGLFIVDVGPDRPGSNLTVTDVRAVNKTLVAGVESQFDVTVVNHGEGVEQDVPILLHADKAVPIREVIKSIEPGGSATVRFAYTFRQSDWVKMRVEADHAGALPVDRNARLYPAAVRPGVRILVVDGNPNPERGESESSLLRTALRPWGGAFSGNLVKVIGADDFEAIDLDPYQALFLCNCNGRNLSRERLERLKSWTRSGGGLVIFLGNDIDQDAYNQNFYDSAAPGVGATTQPGERGMAERYEEGLLPARLVSKPDSVPIDDKVFVRMTVESETHPIFDLLEGHGNDFFSNVSFYRWWGVQVEPRPERRLEGLSRELQERAKTLGLSAGDFQTAAPLIPRPVPRDATELAYVLGSKQARSNVPQAADPNQGRPFFENVKAGFELARRGQRDQARVLARFTDKPDYSPAIVERPYGEGRVILVTTTANDAWHNWGSDAASGSYPYVMIRLARYAAKATSGAGMFTVGEDLTYQFDNSRFKSEAEVFPGANRDDQNSVKVPARPDASSSRRMQVRFDGADAADFYLLRLTPFRAAPGVSGATATTEVLFAANIDPSETDLRRADITALRQKMGDKVTFLRGKEALTKDAIGGGTEVWQQVLLALTLILCVEQLLAFTFGRRR